MTHFKDFELIYNEYFNLLSELSTMIEEEEYEEVIAKVDHKNRLIKKLFRAKKTVDFSLDEEQKVELMEQELREYESKMISSLEKVCDKIEDELKRTNKQVKVNSAYSMQEGEKSGVLINIFE